MYIQNLKERDEVGNLGVDGRVTLGNGC